MVFISHHSWSHFNVFSLFISSCMQNIYKWRIIFREKNKKMRKAPYKIFIPFTCFHPISHSLLPIKMMGHSVPIVDFTWVVGIQSPSRLLVMLAIGWPLIGWDGSIMKEFMIKLPTLQHGVPIWCMSSTITRKCISW